MTQMLEAPQAGPNFDIPANLNGMGAFYVPDHDLPALFPQVDESAFEGVSWGLNAVVEPLQLDKESGSPVEDTEIFSRERRRLVVTALGSILVPLNNTMTSLLWNRRDVDPGEFFDQEIGPYIAAFFDSSVVRSQMVAEVESDFGKLDQHRSFSRQLSDGLAAGLSEDHYGQYQLTKLIAVHPNGFGSGPGWTPRRMVLDLLRGSELAAEEAGVESFAPMDRLALQRLSAGDFDRYILSDVIAHNLGKPSADLQGEQAQIVKFAGFLANFTGIGGVTDGLQARMLSLLDDWPPETHHAFARLRGELAQEASQAMTMAAKKQYRIDALTDWDKGLDKMREEMEQLMSYLASRNNQHYINKPLAVAATTSKHRLQRIRREAQLAREQAESNSSAPEGEAVLKRKLFRVIVGSENGLIHDQSSDEYGGVISDYLRRFQGTPGLAEEVDNVLDRLVGVDLSKGLVRGIKKMGTQLSLGGQPMDFYEFKPMDFPGLSLKTKNAKAMRVFFMFLPNEEVGQPDSIGLIGIMDRREADKFTHSLGNGRNRSS